MAYVHMKRNQKDYCAKKKKKKKGLIRTTRKRRQQKGSITIFEWWKQKNVKENRDQVTDYKRED